MLAHFGPSTGRRLAALLLSLAVALVVAAAPPAFAAALHLKKIALPGGGIAVDLNNSGQAVGAASLVGLGNAFFYDNGTTTIINPPGWGGSIAMRISESGNVVGFGLDGGVATGFLRSGGVTTELLPPGWTAAQAMGVNDSATAVGFGTLAGTERAFGYASGFYVSFLPPGFTSSRAYDVNNSTQIVGSADAVGGQEAFLWDGGVYSFPAPPGWTETEAVRINNRGDILGSGNDGSRDKCFLRRDGIYTAIFDPTAFLTICFDMNELGDVSGIGFSPSSGIRSFVFRDGEYHYLDESISTLFGSASINDSRQLSGGVSIDGVTTAVIASILPEALLQVNGTDGPVAAPRGAPPPVTVSLLGWTLAGRRVDWWFFAQTPAGIRSFDVPGRRWVPGLVPSASIPLRDLRPITLPPAGNAAGPYTYYFGVDLKQNGVMDTPYFLFDRITVFLQ